MNHQHLKLINDIKKVIPVLQTTVADCKATSDEIAAIESWAMIFTDQTALVSLVTKNLLKHPVTVAADVTAMKDDWTSELFYNAGFDAAALITLLVGPIQVESAEQLGAWSFMDVPEFLEGFLSTFISDSNLPELDTCMSATQPLVNYAELIITDLESLNIFDALKQIELFIYHLQLDLQPCTMMQDDITAMKQWATIFTNIEELVSTVVEHYLLHQRAIKKDIDDMKTSFAADDWYTAGSDFADIIVKTIGPIEQPAYLQ